MAPQLQPRSLYRISLASASHLIDQGKDVKKHVIFKVKTEDYCCKKGGTLSGDEIA